MKLSRHQFLHLAAGAAALPAVSRIARAQAYPARPVRMIVPFAAGSATDAFARLIAQKLSEQIGQRFYVENIAGSGGNIGTGRAAKAAPDGYTVLVTASGFELNPILYEKVPYDPVKDFEPVTLAVTTNVVLAVNPSLPVMTVRDLVGLIRANPGKYSYASGGGIGSPGHIVGEQFRLLLGLDLVHVPFNGANLAVGSAVAGHTPVAFVAPGAAASLIKVGKLHALAQTGLRRLQALPDVPTMAEAGYPEIEFDTWDGLFVPAGTPNAIVTLLNRAIVRIVALSDINERLASLGYEPVGSTPDEFGARIRTDAAKWAKLIRAAGIRAQ
jgi:tripartite-type tricarboxylate transporter receptor subunit TctC